MDFFDQLEQWEKFDLWEEVFSNLNQESNRITATLTTDVGKSEHNSSLNRYKDVLPYDHTRVLLENDCYINANHTQILSSSYILTQGPIPGTCRDFWDMAWSYDIPIIIMLCKIVENCQNKCYQYWPLKPNVPVTYGEFVLTTKTKKALDSYMISEIIVHKKDDRDTKKTFIHFHFTSWPDYGVPNDVKDFIHFVLKIQDLHKTFGISKPLCIHCSAGIGRSGTFVLIDSIIKQIVSESTTDNIDVIATLLSMRASRINLVQTCEQFKFVYFSIHYYLKNYCEVEAVDNGKENGDGNTTSSSNNSFESYDSQND